MGTLIKLSWRSYKKDLALRSSAIGDDDIKVSVSGTVHSWYAKEAAARIAWKTRGIWEVKNELAVVDYEFAY